MTSQSEIITLFLVSILMFFTMGNNLGPFPSASNSHEGKKQGIGAVGRLNGLKM